MAKFALAPDDFVRVAHDRYHHPCPQILKRMEVRWLASHAKPTQEAVAELAGVVVSHIHQRTQAADAEPGVSVRRVRVAGDLHPPFDVKAHRGPLPPPPPPNDPGQQPGSPGEL